jgi:hypothetical protein
MIISNTDEEWTMKDGSKIQVKDMDESHVRNCLRLVIRNLRSGKIRRATFEEMTGCDATEADIY